MKKIVIIFLGVLSVLIIISFIISMFSLPKLRSTTLNPENINDKENLEFIFNKALNKKTTLKIEPFVKGKVQLEKNKLVYKPLENYFGSTEYKITISAKNIIGRTDNLEFNFNTDYKEWDQLPEEQKIKEIKETDFLEENHPIIKYFPYFSDHFNVDWIPNNKIEPISTQIELKIDNSLSDENQISQIKAYKKEALEWLSLKNMPLNKLEIEWLPNEAKDL